jgi:hypothetical protein
MKMPPLSGSLLQMEERGKKAQSRVQFGSFSKGLTDAG